MKGFKVAAHRNLRGMKQMRNLFVGDPKMFVVCVLYPDKLESICRLGVFETEMWSRYVGF